MNDETKTPPATAPVSERAHWWIGGHGEVGLSSQAMWRTFMGVREPSSYAPYPADPDDFRRCYLLLKLIPEWRPRIAEMARHCEEWAALAARWDEIETLFLEEIGDPPHGLMAPKGYRLMRSILEPIEDRRYAESRANGVVEPAAILSRRPARSRRRSPSRRLVMGQGLQRVAKLCGGLTVHARGQVAYYGPDGDRTRGPAGDRIRDGESVAWTSQANAVPKRKVGTVLAFVPAGEDASKICPEAFEAPRGRRKFDQYSALVGRYIVAVPRAPTKRTPEPGVDYYAPHKRSVDAQNPEAKRYVVE